MSRTIQQLESERLKWSLETFPEATPESSLRKLESEIKEVKQGLAEGSRSNVVEEFADCQMCLFDAAGRMGISPDEIFNAFAVKLEKNKARKWKKNPDNSYSHIKTMSRTVVISHNNDPLYSFYEPIVRWAWNKLGWEVKTFICDSVVESQVIRLYAHKVIDPDKLVMTSDIDMLPLSDYWNPDPKYITCYGRNLSDEHQPICYVAATAKDWAAFMGDDMDGDIAKFGIHWTADQDNLTYKLRGLNITHIPRPVSPLTGYPVGRVDRSAWDKSLRQPERIDSHLPRPGWEKDNWIKILNLITECLHPTPQEAKWLNDYRNKWIESHS